MVETVNKCGFQFYPIFLILQQRYICNMIINAGTLKEILDHVPDEFEIEYYDTNSNISHSISDKVEIDVSEKKLILKS